MHAGNKLLLIKAITTLTIDSKSYTFDSAREDSMLFTTTDYILEILLGYQNVVSLYDDTTFELVKSIPLGFEFTITTLEDAIKELYT